MKKVFLFTETIIYLSFLFCDLQQIDSSYLKYLGIVLCFAYALFQKDLVLSLAFLFTLLADWFLLIRNDHYLWGTLSFLIVQSIYLYRLYRKGCPLHIPLRILAITAVTIVILCLHMLSPVNILAALYFTSLFCNMLSAFSDPKNRLFFYGLLLFVCCDICVGLFNLLPQGRLYDFVSIGMWFFYLPSQVLIALSSQKYVAFD